MKRIFVAVAALLLAPLFGLPEGRAGAEETSFFCETEEAAETIAAAIVMGQDRADEAAAPYLRDGVCTYLPFDVHIDIDYRGRVYGDGFRVRVVGFTDAQGRHLYGLMPEEELAPKQGA